MGRATREPGLRRIRVKTARQHGLIFNGLDEGDRLITMGTELPASVNRVRLR